MKLVKSSSFAFAALAVVLFSPLVSAQTATPPATPEAAPVATPAPEAAPAAAPAESKSSATGRKGSMNGGAMVSGYYEYSTFESLYADFPADHIAATGVGFKGFFEYGLAERLGLGGSLGFSYLLDANFETSELSRSFWALDVLGSYYFTDFSKKLQPYATFGGGVLFSDRGLSPILDLGVGLHYKLTENLSVKAEVLGKSGVVHNRAEAGVGVAFFF